MLTKIEYDESAYPALDIAVRTLRIAVLMFAVWVAMFDGVNSGAMLESSRQQFFHHDGDVSQSITQVWTMSAKW